MCGLGSEQRENALHRQQKDGNAHFKNINYTYGLFKIEHYA